MGEHVYYVSPTMDHLIATCPALRRSEKHPTPYPWHHGFDPYDETVCGWCQRVFRFRSRGTPDAP